MRLVELFQDISKIAESKGVSWVAFWLVMVLLYLNIALYLMDLYALVKKKTGMETLMVMLLPGTITIMAASLIAILLQMPASAELERVWTQALSPRLYTELLCLAGLFAILWCLTWRLWRKNRENRLNVVRWIFSYSLDFLMAALLTVVGIAGLVGGVDLLALAGRSLAGLGYNLPLYLFLYGTVALALKTALIVLAGLTQIWSMRISRFPYREGHHPTVSFLLYGLLCQNATVRGALAIWIPALCFAFWMSGEVDSFALKVWFPALIVLAFMLYLLMALRPMVDNMARFARWGDRKQVLSKFCKEYFLEEPLVKTKDFTVTRHYLVDERGMLQVFSFDVVMEIKSGWVSDPKKGWVRNLSFLDGGSCSVNKSDMGADEVFRYARQYWEREQFAASGSAQQRLRPPAGEGLYDKLLRFVIAAMVLLFLSQMVRA
ncbi:MAG: hypothetical protein NC543_01055 [bacterium]|nr:hypothetical protein [bacterium]MCM1375048.1 hypothetical protein [Muribaculum sp.]